MDDLKRKSIIREFLDKTQLGLEIGPSIAPIAAKSAGFKVKTLDHTNKEELIKKFSPLVPAEKIQNIEEVDYIWSGQRYPDLIPEQKFSWIVSSHVGEHSVSLVKFLQDSEQMLSDNGKVVLVLPDKRYTFDYYKELTSIKEVIDQDMRDDWSTHSVGTCFEQSLYMAHDSLESWHVTQLIDPNHITFGHDFSEFSNFLEKCKESVVNKEYVDAHNTIMTPHSFDLIVKYLNAFDYIDLDTTKLSKLADHEFLAVLEKKPLSKETLYSKLPGLLNSVEEDKIESYEHYIRLPIKLNVASKFFSSLHIEGFLLNDKASSISNMDVDCKGLNKVGSKSSFNSENFVIDGLFSSDKFSIDSCYLIYSKKNSGSFNSLPIKELLVDRNKSIFDLHTEIRETMNALIKKKHEHSHDQFDSKVKVLYISEKHLNNNIHYEVLKEFDGIDATILNYDDFLHLKPEVSYELIFSYDILDSLPFNTEKILCKASKILNKESGVLMFSTNPVFNGLGYLESSWEIYAKLCNLTVNKVINGQNGYVVPMYNYKDEESTGYSPTIFIEQSFASMAVGGDIESEKVFDNGNLDDLL